MPAESMPPGDAADVDYALVLGSNHAPARGLRLAVQRIAAGFDIQACAPAIRTRDNTGVRYLNAALRIRSAAPLPVLRDALHAIEDEAGRVRGSGIVALDIDIVASVDAAGQLQVHKPQDLQRDFVRRLLVQIGVDAIAQAR